MKRHPTIERKFAAAALGTLAVLAVVWKHPSDAVCIAALSGLAILWPVLVAVQHRGEQAERKNADRK